MLHVFSSPSHENATGPAISVLTRSYLVVLLMVIGLAGPAPHVWIALALIALQALVLYWPFLPQIDFVLTLVTLLLASLGLATLIGPFLAVALVLPGMILLDARLQEIASIKEVPSFRRGRRSSPTFNSLATTALAVGMVGFLAASLTTLLIAATLLTGLLVRLGLVLAATRGMPAAAEPVRLRALASEERHITFFLRSKAPFSVRLFLFSPNAWLSLSMNEVEMRPGATVPVEVTVTPPLAGPICPDIQMMSLDPWGLLWWGTNLSPLILQVIPKARYAASLARRYLEQTGGQQAAATPTQLNRVRGVEYERLREYQPGDRLKDLDWRHTAKFRELVVREFSDPQRNEMIILLNLVASDAEEVDWLGYHVVTSALTAAREGIPSAIAAYDDQGEVLALGPLLPGEIVKHALRLSNQLTLSNRQERVLAPPNLLQLRRAVRSLADARSNKGHSAFAQVLRREIETLEDLASRHPLTLTLRRVLRGSPPPAMITLISRWNHDAEALAVALPRLREQGYQIIDVYLERGERRT